jgi:hypothetical protein
MISSTVPSTKYSCSGSPLILAKGRIAVDRASGSGNVGRADTDGFLATVPGPRPVDLHQPSYIVDLLLAQILKDTGSRT